MGESQGAAGATGAVGSRADLEIVPAPRRAQVSARAAALGRRAGDAVDCAAAAAQPAHHAARRTKPGPGAADRARGDEGRAAYAGGGAFGAAHRAECTIVFVHRGPRLYS